MKFGIRKPSLKGRISSRFSPKRYVRHRLGIKLPRGYGWIRDPKKYVYNKMYYRLTVGVDQLIDASAQSKQIRVETSRKNLYRHYDFMSRKKATAVLLCLFLGLVGAHHFYLRNHRRGMVMLIASLTLYGLIITVPWWWINCFQLLFDIPYAEYDKKALLGKYESAIENGFVEDLAAFQNRYQRLPKVKLNRLMDEMIEPLLQNVVPDGTITPKLEKLKNYLDADSPMVKQVKELIALDREYVEPLHPISTEIPLFKNEKCYYRSYCVWHEIRKDRQYGEYWKEIDRGTVILTNKRIYFKGSKRNKNIWLKNIVNMIPHEQGCFIQKAKGRSPLLTELNNRLVLPMRWKKVIKAIQGKSDG